MERPLTVSWSPGQGAGEPARLGRMATGDRTGPAPGVGLKDERGRVKGQWEAAGRGFQVHGEQRP